ncbi:dTMP kinase [Corynebacterium sp. 3HC-13]|uniref:dTMP kinase n=1 Tax=Corynebacterium poyangense TaxID=2684405 RepID=UPI001CCFFD68|nr:dTMP kinase [Corynebacterium poyangense]MBZ8176870.1 dTMP kinase [Corynebacterium poyangense]
MIICIEGIDGAGKNTLVQALVQQVDAEVLAFPRYQDSVAAQLAAHALHGEMGDMADSPYAMATLFALDRHGARSQLLPFAGTQDRLIVLDRYVASNAAYSVARTGNPDLASWVYHLEFEQLGLPTPDLQILLTTEPEVAAQRAQQREIADHTRNRDRYERDYGLQKRTYQAYLELVRQEWGSPWLATTAAKDILQRIPHGLLR